MDRSSVTKALTRTGLRETYDQRYQRQTLEYFKETFGWVPLGQAKSKKSHIPYDHHDASLDRVRNVGRHLAKNPIIISATSKLISFTIGPGPQYTVGPRDSENTNTRVKERIAKLAARTNLELDYQLEEVTPWLAMQVEAYNRLIRDGECFRRIYFRPFAMTFIEPEDVRQPGNIREVRLETVPEDVQAMFEPDGTPPGILGVVADPDNVLNIFGYWVKDGEQWDFVDSGSVQHIKDNVDLNDPRGVPRFYWGLCHAEGAMEIDGSMRDLFIVQARHAAIYDFDTGTLRSELEEIVDGQERKKGTPDENTPGIVHTKGFKVEIPGIAVPAKDGVEIIQQEQRFLGGLSDIPEHLISEDADSGNRSSLVAAEGPFDRRIKRDQNHLWQYDRAVLWGLLSSALSWDRGEQLANRRSLQMTVTQPSAASRDRLNEIRGDEVLVNLSAMSIPQLQRKHHLDSSQSDSENERRPAPDPNSGA